jgi:phage/plasmid-like protein (TIGR03299 family)
MEKDKIFKTGSTYIKIPLTNVKTAAEALDTAKTNWIAETIDTMTESGISVPDRFKSRAIVRSDTGAVIGLNGKKYRPIQNIEAFNFFDILCSRYNAQYEYVHIIDGGSKIILSAKTKDSITVRKGDEVISYINLINSFDGTTHLLAMAYFKRLVCDNGLFVSGKESKTVIKHTGNVEEKTREAFRVLKVSAEHIKKFEEQAKELANKTINAQQIELFLKGVLRDLKSTRKKNQAEKIRELYASGKGNGLGTAWDLYNGYVEWYDFYRSKGEEFSQSLAILGGADVKEKAFNLALKI